MSTLAHTGRDRLDRVASPATFVYSVGTADIQQ